MGRFRGWITALPRRNPGNALFSGFRRIRGQRVRRTPQRASPQADLESCTVRSLRVRRFLRSSWIEITGGAQKGAAGKDRAICRSALQKPVRAPFSTASAISRRSTMLADLPRQHPPMTRHAYRDF